MRKRLMMAVLACVGLGVAAGCTRKSEVAEQKEELSEVRREAEQQRGEIREETKEEIAEARQEQKEELSELSQKEKEAEAELAQAQAEQSREVQGQVRSASRNIVVLVIPAQGNREMRFQTGSQTEVKRGEQEISVMDLQPGDSVRASYMITDQGNLVLGGVRVQQQPEPSE